ncbi:MAG: SLC13 family permease, partial [Anaerolineales bacterium]
MRSRLTLAGLVILLAAGLLSGLIASYPLGQASAQQTTELPVIVGTLVDPQQQPIEGALITLFQNEVEITSVSSQADGRFLIPVADPAMETFAIEIERAHYEPYHLEFASAQVEALTYGESVVIPEITLDHHIGLAFWLSAAIFVAVLVLIASGGVHNTLATLIGASLLLGISYIGHPISEKLFIFDFFGSISYIDWNVIFLIMGMMIFIAIVEHTGVFQWMAFAAYRISQGKMLLLLPILMLITGVASAFLDNVTTMLLMTPITVQIALSVGINPLALLIPEVMASNVIGVSTLVGTPTNILIGSYAGISFNGFLQNLTPGVFLAFIGQIIYRSMVYRKERA